MRFARVDEVGETPSPNSGVWDETPSYEVTMAPVPVNSVDTSKYVRDTIAENDIGAVGEIGVEGVHDGERVAIKMSWRDASRNDKVDSTSDFADKASVAFPVSEGASVMTMGSERAPLNAWYWRADRTEPYDVLAKGFGSTERREPVESGLRCSSEYDAGGWNVVFSRRLAIGSEEYANISRRTEVAFAVWEGSNRERGPLKSYSGEFRGLVLEGLE
ncbi:MAG: ethylbenzene dehydrogenase-related protein [Halobacteria archaeon]|nr:ethylbenzene dehydrogenase-related protein [Halobacteria archaeon]